jgi:hypothetical protein
MLAVVQIVSVVYVVHVDIIRSIPNRGPCFWARINHAEPVASELKTRRAIDHDDRHFMDSEPVSATEMCAKAIFWNAVSIVAAPFVPGAMLTSPVVGPLALPDILPDITRCRLIPSYLVQLLRPVVGVLLAAMK